VKPQLVRDRPLTGRQGRPPSRDSGIWLRGDYRGAARPGPFAHQATRRKAV